MLPEFISLKYISKMIR